mgnify:CR=1 FL=1
MTMRSGYVNLKTDWGFKHLMGHEPQMRSFLNSLLSEEYGEIKSLTFENVEVLSDRKGGRGVIFDLFCTTDSGDKIIVEMQNYSQLFFKTRANYYLYTLMTKVLGRGVDWNKMKKDIPHLIGIFFLGKRMGTETKAIIETEEFDRIEKTPFWDRMRKYFIILENFDFTDLEQPSFKDCWIEIIKNLGDNMYKIHPSVYEKADPALLELIERAQVGNLSDDEYLRYEAGLKALEDYIDFDELLEDAKAEATAKGLTEGHAKGLAKGHAEGLAEGLAEGRAEGLAEGIVEGIVEGERRNKLENAKRMLEENFTVEMIAKITKLSKNEIENLKGLI